MPPSFKIRRGLSHYSVAVLNLTSPWSHLIIFSSRLICHLISPSFKSVLQLMKRVFRNSPSQPPKITLPSPKHPDFKTRHTLSRFPVANSSCPSPGGISRQKFSVLAKQSIASCVNHILPKIIPVI